MSKKNIPCRVCGKEFEPCAYCQNYPDTFKWRNFACSTECAKKYISETIAYRENKHMSKENKGNGDIQASPNSMEASPDKAMMTTRKRKNKTAILAENSETTHIKNNETE